MGFFELAAIATATLGCATDLLWRRIPNSLTFGAAGAALVSHFMQGGAQDVLMSAAGWGTAVLVFLPFFALGGMGGGDIKLLASLGAWMGPGAALWIAIWTSLSGGVMALAMALSTGYLTHAFLNLSMLAGYWRHVGFQPHPALTLESAEAPRLPYAVPIAIGLGVTLWLR